MKTKLPPTTIQLVSLSPSEVVEKSENLVAVYRAAFCMAPYYKREDEVLDFATSLPAHAEGPDFHFLAATRGASGEIAGYAYRKRPLPGQLWHDLVREQLLQVGAATWLDGSYQLVQMAVHPSFHRQGIGSQLLHGLVASAPNHPGLLTTMAGDTPATRFYLGHGWRVLVDSFVVPGLRRPYRIMGMGLP